ncbi:Gfo/Idh/MocA family protein [Paenibacillus eucommiae]|uniref:Dehydrogenase n=1 Tax=Paenibacillus eucommiae TaxID=1355755 RepID=A0ABS4J5K9_9BACL|nr:Gfo/Idh/MocA family oxidoreductase [Paenibacillus eucommiae]MBP1994570.1 putative dehydrogenase [Paenibacillus eucommiae]
MKKMTAILLGAGGRAVLAYAPYAKLYPQDLEFVAVAEPIAERRESFVQEFNIPSENVFTDWEQVFERPRLADIAIICTQDRLHYKPAMKALAHGYHVLLEKPMSPEPLECIELELAAKKNDRLLTICHVLRYTNFWHAIKQTITDGRIGDVVSIQMNENVGYHHIAHSFVRGSWNNSETTSPMILAKSCHDMDILSWLMDQECTKVSSFGSLTHFTLDNAPEGSTERCLDGCAVESSCPYSAIKLYMQDRKWLSSIEVTENGLVQALKEGKFGRCVYRCDNNVVDHQVVNLEFMNKSTATFSMCGFTHDISRGIQIMGTKGEIRGYMGESAFTVYNFLTREQNEVKVRANASGHGGGDEGIMRSFLQEARHYNGSQSLTSAENSVRSHLIAFAAEESRLNGGRPIDLKEFRAHLLRNQ